MGHAYLDHWKKPSIIPGFGVAMGFTLFYLLCIVVIPLSGLFMQAATLSWQEFMHAALSPRVMHAYYVSFGVALLAAVINAIGGFLVAWVLVRYEFPAKKLLDAMIDLPFALPTAVAGVALTAMYAPNGWLGQYLEPIGIKVAFTPLGILVAMVFVGIPLVVRTVQPVLQDSDKEWEEAAACLGASRFQTFYKIMLPHLLPSLLTGFAMAFARALGEYGSVVFIAGNLPMVSEIVPLLIIVKLEQFDYAGATAVAVVMLAFSFMMLFAINGLQRWSGREMRRA